MITSALVTQLRRDVSDVPVLHQDKITGDNSSTVYKTKYSPVLEDSMILRIGGTAKTEGLGNDYTLDDDTGVIDLASVTSSGIEARYKGVNFTNQEWLDAIGDTIDEMGDQFFRMVVRSTSGITLSAGVQVYDGPSGCLKIIEFLESDNFTSGGTFKKPFTNWRHDRRANKLILGSAPSKANYAQLTYCRKVAKPTALSSTLDLEDAWIQMVKHGTKSKYLRSVAAKIAQQGNVNTEQGMLRLNQIRAVAVDEETKYELLRRRVKPVLPALANNFHIPTSGPVS